MVTAETYERPCRSGSCSTPIPAHTCLLHRPQVQSFDQKFESSNKALLVSCQKGLPVRVVRSHKVRSVAVALLLGGQRCHSKLTSASLPASWWQLVVFVDWHIA
jgi:SAD/SRA domain